MASLSVGPTEYARFEAERLRGALAWPALVEDLARLVCANVGCDEVIMQGAGCTAAQVAELRGTPHLRYNLTTGPSPKPRPDDK
jgi:hypothetical protein